MARALLVAVLGSLFGLARLASAAPASCPAEDAILVDTGAHRLRLCAGGHVDGTWSVALGGGGLGKQREGDRKTPLGTYPLAAPRPSERFHQFILVGYPTPAQRASGLTGSDIGIHGPSRRASWLGPLRGWMDWTDGCIAVPTDDDIDAVAAWLRAHPAAQVQIE